MAAAAADVVKVLDVAAWVTDLRAAVAGRVRSILKIGGEWRVEQLETREGGEEKECEPR
jgi:hypothetical protein